MRRGELHGRGVGKLDKYTFFTTFFHREYDTQGNETSLAQRRRRGKDWKRIETKDSRLSGAGEERQRERERRGRGRWVGRQAGRKGGGRAGGQSFLPRNDLEREREESGRGEAMHAAPRYNYWSYVSDTQSRMNYRGTTPPASAQPGTTMPAHHEQRPGCR